MASLRSGISSQTHLKSESRRYNEDHDTRDASSSTSLNTVRFPIQRENILITESQRDREGRHRLEGTLSSLRRGCEHAGSAWLGARVGLHVTGQKKPGSWKAAWRLKPEGNYA